MRFFPTFLKTIQIILGGGMRVFSEICVFGYAFFTRIYKKKRIFLKITLIFWLNALKKTYAGARPLTQRPQISNQNLNGEDY